VKRTIDGSTVRYVEFMEDEFSDSDVLEDSFFVDSGLTYNGVATDTVIDLEHLEGQTVQVVADGGAHPDRTVASGSITLNAATYTKVHVGLYGSALVDSLNLEPEIRGGSSQGLLKRIPVNTLRFDRTVGGEICSSPDDTPSDIFTGDGTNTALSLTFRFARHGDIAITRRVIATGAETTMQLNTDYTVTGGGIALGTVTPVDGATDFPSTVKWIIVRSVPDYSPIFFRAVGDQMDAPPPLFTGDKRVALECGWSREGRWMFRQPQPLPCNLLAIIPQVELSGR
jgi:hypothetical protein